jgi:anaerobic magnesium-protoporphyrin IX monomethyl ester cyclase
MKVLLINPPQTFYPGSEQPAGNLPLGLMYLAALLQKANFKVEILDAFMVDSVFQRNGVETTVGMPFTKIRHELIERKPDVVGISGPFTCQIDNAVKISNLVKEVNPNILTVTGGPHVTLASEAFLREAKDVDIVVRGEGEYTMLEIAQTFEDRKQMDKILGIAYRQSGKIRLNPPRPLIKNLDQLPYPAYNLVDMERYLSLKKIGYRSFKDRAISMITSRGCPFNCCFCAVHLHMGRDFRAHSAKYVVDHIQFVVKKFNVRNVFFEDDNLTLDIERFENICNDIISRKINIGWETPNGVRADCLNRELLKKMKQSGCKSVFIGVESGDQQILNNVICKSLDLNRVVEFAKDAKEIGLKTGAFYIIGFPGETKENMQKTVDFALRLKREYDVGMHLFVATPSFGTRLYEECVIKGYVEENLTWNAFARARQPKGMPLITTKDFTPAQVKEIAARAIAQYKRLSLINHLKNPRMVLKTVFEQPQLIGKYIKALFN